jgi:hypothetical protein
MLSKDYSPSNEGYPNAITTPLQEAEGQPQDIIGQIALGSLQSTSFTNSVATRNGLSLLSSLLADPLIKAHRNEVTSDHRNLLHELPYEIRAGMPPRDAAKKLINTYFEHCDFFSPIIAAKEPFSNAVEALYQSSISSQQSVNAKFQALIVFGTAVLLLNRIDASVPISRSEAYFAAAMRVFSDNSELLCTGGLEHLKNLLLIVQHCCFCSNLTAAWHFIGLATRLAVELNLHKERSVAYEMHPSEANARKWLFWLTYMFERNLCVIIDRPFSIPDEAIETLLPDHMNGGSNHALALHLIKCRRLESEIHTTLNHRGPLNGAKLNARMWRSDITRRLLEWHSTVPSIELTSQFASAEIFDGYLHNIMVLLYYPSLLLPSTSDDELRILSEHAVQSIDAYKQAFRSGNLRFYWRTVHNLFRSGVSAVYCIHVSATQSQSNLNLSDLSGSLHSCSSTLWGMAERYTPGKAYREIFDNLVNSVIKQEVGRGGTAYDPSLPSDMDEQISIFDQIMTEFEDANLPPPAIDFLSLGFDASLHNT